MHKKYYSCAHYNQKTKIVQYLLKETSPRERYKLTRLNCLAQNLHCSCQVRYTRIRRNYRIVWFEHKLLWNAKFTFYHVFFPTKCALTIPDFNTTAWCLSAVMTDWYCHAVFTDLCAPAVFTDSCPGFLFTGWYMYLSALFTYWCMSALFNDLCLTEGFTNWCLSTVLTD